MKKDLLDSNPTQPTMTHTKSGGVDTYTIDPIHVTFIGCRGCGKTSLMASMFNELQQKCISSVTAAVPTMQLLSESLADLLHMIDDYEINDIVTPTALKATEHANDFKFIGTAVLGSTSNRKRFRYPFVFTDLPGNWYAGEAAAYEKEVDVFLERSSVCLLTIDAPALMSDDYTHHIYNRPDIILNWFNECLGSLKRNNVRVVFVLSRCESFVQKDNQRQILFDKVRRSYAPLIDVLRKAGIDICGTWVETLGGVQFLEYRHNEEERMVPVFRRTGDYTPRNCEIPLLLTLQKTVENLKLFLEKKRGFWTCILDWLGITHYDLAIKGLEKILKELETGLAMARDNAMFEL